MTIVASDSSISAGSAGFNWNAKHSNIKYNYPFGLDITPGSVLHNKILSKVLTATQSSRNHMEQRFEKWNQIQEDFTTFMKIEDFERLQNKEKRFDLNRPVEILIPYSVAIIETMVAYLMAAFIDIEPIFQYEGVGPEDKMGSMLLELLIDHQIKKGKTILNLHTAFRDSFLYGIGVGSIQWQEIFRRTYDSDFNSTRGKAWEGNKLENIDPFYFLPDPNIPIDRFQEGEYAGFIKSTHLIELLKKEEAGEFFNVKYLKRFQSKNNSGQNISANALSTYGSYYDARNKRSKRLGAMAGEYPVDLIYHFRDIVPKDWELGKSEYPEKWLFVVAGDALVIQCRPLGMNHDMFPLVVGAPEYDGYSLLPMARVEIIEGMQKLVNWLFNSHIRNVAQVMNNTLIADPFHVNMLDVERVLSRGGGVIRTARPAWGQGVAGKVEQLQVHDVTTGHIRDSGMLISWLREVAGTPSLGGQVRQSGPERVTGKEIDAVQGGSFTRMERLARIFSLQFMQPAGEQFAFNTQQFMKKARMFKVLGRNKEELLKTFEGSSYVLANPEAINVDMDLVVRDGTIPKSDVESWLSLLNIIGKNQELQSVFNVPMISKYMLQQQGVKNVHDFIRVNIKPDETLQREAERGNIVPNSERGIGMPGGDGLPGGV